jgi:hypothetical protein
MIGLPHPLFPTFLSVLDRRHTGRLRKRENMSMGEGVGVLEEPNHTTARKLVLYKSFNILCRLQQLTEIGSGKTT